MERIVGNARARLDLEGRYTITRQPALSLYEHRIGRAPITIAAPSARRGYAVTALVFDGTTYRTAPVQIGGR